MPDTAPEGARLSNRRRLDGERRVGFAAGVRHLWTPLWRERRISFGDRSPSCVPGRRPDMNSIGQRPVMPYFPGLMAVVNNPALAAFCAWAAPELVLAQVLVRRLVDGFELRHLSDREARADSLKPVALAELRVLANFTATGAFRPIKAAPNLRAAWRCRVNSEPELEAAINQLYPGALADWFAARQADPPVTHYREHTARQTGMYRITTRLSDAQAAQVIRAGCDARFCLKRRLWTVAGLPPDTVDGKSLIPCLEPCAVMLEFARQAARIEQAEGKPALALAPSEIASLLAALEAALAHPSAGQREADLSAADNPRRLQLLRAKLQGFAPVAGTDGQE